MDNQTPNPNIPQPPLPPRKPRLPNREKQLKQQARALRRKTRVQLRQKKLCRKYQLEEAEPVETPSRLKVWTAVFSKRLPIILLASLVVFASLVGYFYYLADAPAVTVMSLNYEQGSKGLTPNHTRFNINLMTSDEVMERALQYAGIEGVAPHELGDHVSASPIYTRSTGASEYYIATSYRIAYTPFKAIKDVSAKSMLSLICKAYRDVFLEKYTNTLTVSSIAKSELGDLEYNEMGNYFNLSTSILQRYVEKRTEETSTFVSERTGKSFTDLKNLINNLVNFKIADYNAYVWENGIVKDSALYVQTMLYKNQLLSNQHRTASTEYQILSSTISEYNKAMTASVLIPTYNNDTSPSGETVFYMARTTSGIDSLANRAANSLSTAEYNLLSMNKNADRIKKVDPTGNSVKQERANTMATEILTELESIQELLYQTDGEFMEQKTRNYLSFENKTPSLTSRVHAKQALLITALFFLLISFAYVCEYKSAYKKRQRAAAQKSA